MVWGNTGIERITFVHEELFLPLWPRNKDFSVNISELLPEVRNLIAQQKYGAAAHLACKTAYLQQEILGLEEEKILFGPTPHPAFDLIIDRETTEQPYKYGRYLNLETGEASVASIHSKNGESCTIRYNGRNTKINTMPEGTVSLDANLQVLKGKSQKMSENEVENDSIKALIGQMTLEEKVSMVNGESGKDPEGVPYVGYIAGVKRLSIPSLAMQNGGSGAGGSFGLHRRKVPATAFPVAAAQASTWNRDLLHKMGIAIGLETKARGRDVLLGPMINIVRVPEGGRNFELFSEDPYLSARSTVSVIEGIQETGIMANAKHIVANNQESLRGGIDALVTERALREIYLPSFEAAVKEAEVASIMSAMNKVNGTYCSEHPLLLRQITKEEWGFKGFIMCDWNSGFKTVSAVKAGLDMEMPGWEWAGKPKFKLNLASAVRDGQVNESTLDGMVYRILREMKRFGYLGEKKDFPAGEIDTPAHRKLARQIAVEGAVLLKNDNRALPLDPEKITRVALFGDADKAYETGGGSSIVVPFYRVSPVDGIRNRLKNAKATHYESPEKSGPADVAIVFISRSSSEGGDRKSISLAPEAELVREVSNKYPRTIVMLRTPGAYTMPWINNADAVFQMWYPGQEEGNAEAALLFGDVSPSGKLPVTFGKEREDFPGATEKDFPGIGSRVEYSEGIFVGYRYFERNQTTPLFPFGHGLSYTTFRYSDLKLSSETIRGNDSMKVAYTITNTGNVAGAEVSQLYIQDAEASVERPVKELKGFNKVFLEPGESKVVRHNIGKRDLSFWDVENKNWKAEEGSFNILVGASSADIRLEGTIRYRE